MFGISAATQSASSAAPACARAARTRAVQAKAHVSPVAQPVGALCKRTVRSGIASLPRRLSASVAAAATTSPSGTASPPSAVETARTIMELVGSGTLSTLDGSGTPLGTFATYVLDSEGLPLLRLRNDAVHTQNLRANPACSLFVHAPLQPVRAVARITLIGTVEEITGDEKDAAQLKHAAANADAIGVDAPREDDVFMRLNPAKAFYVGGLGTEGMAEDLDLGDYRAAEVDTLAEYAPELVENMNSNRPIDVLRIAGDNITNGSSDDVTSAELLWVDKLGIWIHAEAKGKEEILRVNFGHEAIDERDAKSCLTMMAQQAWENERPYNPSPVPPPAES